MKTMKLFVVLIVVAVASLLSVPVVQAAPEGPQSVLTYTAPYKIKLDKETFDCKIASHKFDKATGVGTITFNGQLKEIRGPRYYCFYKEPITSVEIPEGVTSIDKEAFAECSKLKSITIPSSVTKIGEDAFSGCTGELIVNCNIPDVSNYSGAFYHSKFTKVTIGNSVTSIGKYAFRGCSSLTSITIPDSVTKIGEGAFSGCSRLTSITIPDSVTSIGEYAFSGCSNLKDVNVNITDLAKYCTNNVTHEIPGNIHLYIDNKGITELTIPNSVTSIGKYAFVRCSSLTGVTIPDSVTEIGYRAFSYCSRLTSITIPDSVTSIGEYAFYNCRSLKDVNVNITDLAKYCTNNVIHEIPGNKHLYIDNKEITELTIPNSVTSIGSSAFRGCSNLTSITIPDSVTSIGNRAFSDCSSLTDVTTSERWVDYFVEFNSVKRINGKELITDGGFNFLGNTLVWVDRDASSVSIPASVKSIAPSAFEGCKNINNVNVADLNVWLRSGVDMSSSEGWNLYDNGKLVTNVTIPNGVTKIADGQFCNNESLTSITIPDSVASIGNSAFYGCSSLCSITIPASVKEIGKSAFEDCRSLTNVTISNGVTWIGEKAFNNCSSLYSVTIGNGVTKIGDYAFKGCSSLGSITIPASVKEIGDSAFYNCSSLYSVTIGNGVTKICDKAFYDCNSLGSITIPASVAYIGDDVFTRHEDCGTLYIYMKGATPPALGGKFLNYSFYWSSGDPYWSSSGAPQIYVPKNALFNYRTADVWKNMADRIYPMD